MQLFIQGLAVVCSPITLVFMCVGTVVGIIFGAVPGLSSVMAISLFLPATYGMDPAVGISVLIALYIGSVSGGLISAILLKIPGTPASIATCYDGKPMLDKGEGMKALGGGIVFSFIGTLISVLALIFIAPSLASVAINFGPCEYFAISIFSLMLIATLSSGNMVKGIFAGILGIAFSTVGIAPVDSVKRFTFGFVQLSSGFNTLTVLIGLFAVTEVIKIAETSRYSSKEKIAQVNTKCRGFGFSLKEFAEQVPNMLLSALVGLGIGILPGIGAGTSNMVAYTISKNVSRHPEKYGTGIFDGIVASETANNASVGGAMIPLLCLGIPGDGVTALLLGAFMVHGITPGPLLFTNQAPMVYTLFAACIIANILMLIFEFFGLRIFIKLLNVPKYMLLPIVFVLCVVGAYALNSRMFDVYTVILFGAIGYLFSKFKVPTGPMVIGFILGSMAETNFRRGMMLTDGNFMGFFGKPIAAAFIILTIGYFVYVVISNVRKANKKSGAKA
ncbi:MAG: Tat pathway signal protein [Ruminococcaceae bacterium]|nr:Tat pathway signal protein [Oscillospiraceae bacterium]